MSLKFQRAPAFDSDMEVWGALDARHSYIIATFRQGTPNEGYGYSASWKFRNVPEGQSSNYLTGSPFRTFHEAEMACRRHSKGGRNA